MNLLKRPVNELTRYYLILEEAVRELVRRVPELDLDSMFSDLHVQIIEAANAARAYRLIVGLAPTYTAEDLEEVYHAPWKWTVSATDLSYIFKTIERYDECPELRALKWLNEKLSETKFSMDVVAKIIVEAADRMSAQDRLRAISASKEEPLGVLGLYLPK